MMNALGIRYPIIQAPMAGGATTPELVAAVSNSGALDSKWILALQEKGTKLIGTATNITEAFLLEGAGVEMIVAQGNEAGGHRGTFIGRAEDSLMSTVNLVTRLTNEVSIPVVAAGGVMNGKGIVAFLKKGAAAVQMGTAFLTCVESGIPACYKKVLLSQAQDKTVLTTAFSGKLARGIRNQFIDKMTAHQEDILDYPIQNALTSPMRKVASMQDNTDFMSMWAGQFSYECRELPVTALMHELVQDLHAY